MSRLAGELEAELEYEDELEDEWEGEEEGEEFLGALGGIARTVGGLLGEGELEDELEDEDEDEGEGELEDEWEGEDEDEAEQFFKSFRKFAPFLRTLAKTAGPLVATAIGGPAAGVLARAVTSQLEGEEEIEGEFEEMATAPLSSAQAMAEYYAARAAQAESESEAEAFAGVAAYITISPRERRDLQRMLPSLLRGAATVTRLLYSNRMTRPGVRMVPGIVNAAGATLARRVAAGEPVGPVETGRAFGQATRRVLSGGRATGSVLRRHARGLSHIRRHGTRGRRYYSGTGYSGRDYGGYDGYGTGGGYRTRRGVRRSSNVGMPRTPVRTSIQTRPVSGRPRPGHVRVVTPVRLPATNGRAPRTIRVVSDVKVPRGAVAGRPTTSSNTRRR
jgi:hypothetical protein